MTKRNIIIAVVVVVLIGAGVGYYFLYYTNDDDTELTENTVQVTEEETQEDTVEDTAEESEEEQEDQSENEDDTKEVEKAEDEDKFEVNLEEKYAYRKELRNPFGNVTQVEPEIKKEDLTIPFRLDGIIANGNQNIAVISTSEGPRFISNSENIGEYYISEIKDEQIKIRYKYLTVFMKIGGALVE